MHTVSSSHSLTSMSSSRQPGLPPNPNPNRKSSASHERKEVKKRSRKRKNSLNRYGSSKKRRLASSSSRIKVPTTEVETPLDSSLLEPRSLSNGALDSVTKSTFKGFQEPSEQNEKIKFAGKDNRWNHKDLEVHVDLGMDNRITSCSQAAQLDNAEVVCSPASLLPRTNPLEPVWQLPCDRVQDTPEGRVLRPRRLRSKESKENLPPPAESLKIVGRRVEVYWPLDAAWYCGLITAYDDIRKKHKVCYDDGEEEWLCLSHEKFKFEMSFKTESAQAGGTVQESGDGKKGCAVRDDSSLLGLPSLGLIQGVHSKGSSNGSSMPITSRRKRPGAGFLEDTSPQADTSAAKLSCTDATLGEEITGLRAQKHTKFFLRRHKNNPTRQGNGGSDWDGDDEVKTGCVYVRRLKCGAKGRSPVAGHQMSGDNQQVESPKGQRWQERSNCRRKPKHSNQTPQDNDDMGHLCSDRPQDIKNLVSTLEGSDLGASVYGQHPKLTSPRKRNRESLKDDASVALSSRERSVCMVDSMDTGAVRNTGVSTHCKSEQPHRTARKKHKVKSLAHTALAAEEKKVKVEAVAGPCNQEHNQKAEDLAIPMMAESFGVIHHEDTSLFSHQGTEVIGAGKSAMQSSRGKYNSDILEPKLGGSQSRGVRKPTGSQSRGYHKYRRTMKKNQRLQKFTSSNKLLSQSITTYNDSGIPVSCNQRFPHQNIASNEASSTPCKFTMGFHTGSLFSDTAVMKRASCTSDSSVSEGNIMHFWAPHEFARQHLILESNSSLRLRSPLRDFHSTIHFLRPDMVFNLFTWQLFNMLEAVGLFSGDCFEGRFSWMGSTRDLANIVLLLMTIIKSLPFTSQRCRQHWQGRVLYELWSVLLRREHWVRSLPTILSPQADDLLMQHLRQMIVGHSTSNVTFRQMLNIFSCYILKPFVIAFLCEKGVQLTAVEQRFLLLTCPLREGITFKRQSVKWVKLRSYAGAEADFSSYLFSFPMAKHQCTATYLFEKPMNEWINSAAHDGCMQQLIPIPSFKFSSNQGLQFTTAMVDCKKIIPQGGNYSLHLRQIVGAVSLSTDSLRVIEEAREFLLHGKFACFNHFQEFQDFYTSLCFNSMLQKCLYLADGKESHCVEGADTVAEKHMIFRHLSLKVDSVKEEGMVGSCEWEVESGPTLKSICNDSSQHVEKDNFCLKSRKTITEPKFSKQISLEENNVAAIKEERFLHNFDHHFDAGAVSNTPVGSSPFCSMNDLVYNASGSSSSSSHECTTKWKRTKMAEIGFRHLDVRDQHGQGVYGDSSYLSLGQHSNRRAGPKCRPRGAEQESTDIEHSDLCCVANVLITRNNRSWREVGISVELQSRGSEWVLSVQIDDVIHSHKVLESTINSKVNRYTHAMMWKGGDEWTLEFSDRTQWTRFKGMHEECGNRNARAAFVKQIPIPSVKQIQDSIEGKHVDCPRFWASGGLWPGEVETALNCRTRVYDMDSEDENWLAEVNKRASTEETISMDAFERIIDKLERITYLRQGEMVVTDEVAELCENLASENAVLLVHAYWFNKRLIRENALIRYFESPLWRKYRKQCDSWEARMNELQQMLPHETKEELHKQYPQPSLFAFCLPSRGLDASNSSKRVQRQRSQKHLNPSFKYTRTSSFETPEEPQRVSLLRSQRGHDSLSVYEKGDFWQRKTSWDGFFEQLISNVTPHTAAVVGHKSLEEAKANAAAARHLAQMYFLRFDSALQRAVAAVIEFEAIYFAELALINLKCESAVASCEQLLFFKRRIERVLNQFFSLSGKEDFLNRDGNHGALSDDADEDIDDDDDDNDPLCTVSMQADGFGGSPLSDGFLREEGSFLSISERSHLEAWMRSTLRQRAR